jgi:poly(3-hydroxybutyrate) depolymerase
MAMNRDRYDFARCASLAIVFILLASATQAAQVDARLAQGSGSFRFPFVSAGTSREIVIWYHRPATAATDAPVVFVMHGAGRNAQSYRKYWIPIAEQRQFVLLVPEFSRAQFPMDYNLERMTLRDGIRVAQGEWPYTAIERIFDAVRADNGLSARTYDIYGHSAGAQFVHRLVLLLPDARFRVAVAANAGWYTMPDHSVAYPYGLAAAEVSRDQLVRALGRKLIVLLGDQDVDPNHRDLRRTSEANAQGEHRYARGQAFFERARRAAEELNTVFAWELHSAPGVAHSNARMAPHAAPFVGNRE